MAYSDEKRISTEAGVAGAGTGTALVGLANLMPEGVAKSVVLYVAPAATVSVAWLWRIARAYLSSWATRREVDNAIKEACAARDSIHASHMASPQHKQNAQETVERLERLKFELLNERVSSVRAAMKTDG